MIVTFTRIDNHPLRLPDGVSLYDSTCTACGLPVLVSVRDGTEPEPQVCGGCRQVEHGWRPAPDDAEEYAAWREVVERRERFAASLSEPGGA